MGSQGKAVIPWLMSLPVSSPNWPSWTSAIIIWTDGSCRGPNQPWNLSNYITFIYVCEASTSTVAPCELSEPFATYLSPWSDRLALRNFRIRVHVVEMTLSEAFFIHAFLLGGYKRTLNILFAEQWCSNGTCIHCTDLISCVNFFGKTLESQC